MKIFPVLIAACWLWALPAFSQSNNWTWAKPVSTSGYCFAESIITDHQDNSYMAGSFDHYISFGDTAFTPHTYGGTDSFIAKYDPDGGFSWALHFYVTDGVLFVYNNKLELLNDSCFIVFGMFIGTLHISNQLLIGNGYGWNTYVAKYSTRGDLLKLYRIGGTTDANNLALKADQEGNLFLTVQTFNGGTMSFGNDTTFTLNASTLFLAKFSPDLALNWVYQYSCFYDFARTGSLMTDKSGNVTLMIPEVHSDIYFNKDTLHPHSPYSALFHTFNSAGVPVLVREVPNHAINWSVQDSDHTIYTFGEIWQHDTLVLGHDTIFTQNTYDLLLVSYDSLLNIKWYRQIPRGYGTWEYYPVQLTSEQVVVGVNYETFVNICDTTFSPTSPSEFAFSFYNKDGTCTDAFTTRSNNTFVGACGFSLDDCNDLVLSGDMVGETYFGKDTLNAPNGSFIARFHHGAPVPDLGPDTTITNHDSIVLEAPLGYDSYLWNTGDTLNPLVVNGSEFTAGTYQFWVRVRQNGCEKSDSVKITVRYSPGIFDNKKNKPIRIQPNPTHSEVSVLFTGISKGDFIVEMTSLQGECVLKKQIRYEGGKNPIQIALPELEQGIYFIAITGENLQFFEKLIVI